LVLNFALSLMTLTAIGSTVTMGVLHATTSNENGGTFHA
jgi:hypothetical protein